MECPNCKGKGTVFAHMNTGPDSSKHHWGDIQCMTCRGSGKITQEQADRIEAGQKLYRQRLNSGETLVEAAARQGMTAAQLSAIEHGRTPSNARVKAAAEGSPATEGSEP